MSTEQTTTTGPPRDGGGRPAQLTADAVEEFRRRAGELGRATGHARPEGLGEVADLFRTAHETVMDALAGRALDPRVQAVVVPRLVDSVLRPLADVLQGAGEHERAGPTRPDVDIPAPRLGAPPRSVMDRVWDTTRTATQLRSALGRADRCPPELAEATAALQDLACVLVAPGKAAARLEELWQLQSDLPAVIQAACNGPHLVTNVPRLVDHLGQATRPAPQLALCRCGASAIKPLCDGTHARTDFTDAKDPHRVRDRRDTYPGLELTVLDNRGICQHSGLCTDRLPVVFRIDAEPFVAPSGARMDEIIRAVRDCPSGALSYALDGVEAREQADWANGRPPAVEVTKDGPYRITGRIPLLDAAGVPAGRDVGSSLEHYALCRCGHSQNKPFCSGMHWYVGFRDPVPAAGHEPTPFEWAGGLPALIRAARLLYERHVPADPLLAPTFANMPPEQPRRLAGWLGEALGGPASDYADDLRTTIGWTDGDVGEPQRARWVALLAAAADDALLPVDAAFRAVLSGCAEWLSRTAEAPGEEAAVRSTPRWDWGPGGPPPPPASEEAAQAAEEVSLPATVESIGFEVHVRPLFRERDRQAMRFALDLWSADDVRAHAADVLDRVQEGSMPCDGAWPPERVDVLRRWIVTGMQP